MSSFVTIYHPFSFKHPVTHEQKVHNAVVIAVTLLLEIPLYLSYLWAAWDRQHQTLYDKVAGTVVTREAAKSSSPRRQRTITFDAPA